MSQTLGLLKHIPFLLVFVLGGCATFKPQMKQDTVPAEKSEEKPSHTFFLAGGFGDSKKGPDKEIIDMLVSQLEQSTKNATLIFTGDNISPTEDNEKADLGLIDMQLRLTENFKGSTIFVPGNNEWKSKNTDKIEEVEQYLDSIGPKAVSFFPKNTCPIEHHVINDELDLILVDSKWFISNWSRVKDINKKCTDIITRRRFMEELEGYINDGQGKNIVIAMHHPIFSNGKFAAKETFKSHLRPVPILGTLLSAVRDLDGFDPDQLNSRSYYYLRVLVSALATNSDRITLISGHEESLQYLKGGEIHQIISGSLSEKTATKRSRDKLVALGGSLDYEGIYTHGAAGFARLDYFKDGSSQIRFFSPEQPNPIALKVLPELKEKDTISHFPEITAPVKKASIIKDELKLDKSGLYKFFWGKRYRDYYGKEVTADIADLDTLYGGLTVLQKGGGHQSFSLRLQDKNGKEYAMRSLRKNALKFLKFKVKGISFTRNEYKNTFTEELVTDFFTTAHPYIQLIIPPLARAAEINHADTRLFYVPEQKALGEFNGEFGNELYYIEERPSAEFASFEGFNRSNPNEKGAIEDFESTSDILEKMKSDESYLVDEESFIRARIFDMLIGDWDRHQDQWRWAEYESKEDEKFFLPIPRDRDAAFAKFDGIAIPLIRLFVPNARFWQSYSSNVQDVKWALAQGNSLDRMLITKYGPEVWEKEALRLQQLITTETIDRAFLRLPAEVRDSSASNIKKALIGRLKRLPEYAKKYSNYLNKIVILHGTEKDDIFEISRMDNGKTRVVIRRALSDDPDKKIYERTLDATETKEVWIYALGDDDVFRVTGKQDGHSFLRLIGGYGKDQYTLDNGKDVKVYDWEHEKSEFEGVVPPKQLTNLYETNTYHHRYFNENNNVLKPNLGYTRDDRFYFGLTDIYTYNGLNGNPFRQKHTLSANFFPRFKAFEVDYNAIFGNIIPGWNFELNGYFTSKRFRYNFFGFGNETINTEEELGLSFNRAGLQELKLDAGLAFHKLRFKALYESYKLLQSDDRFFTSDTFGEEIFELQQYVGAETTAEYSHDDAEDFPTKAIYLGLTAGYKLNPQSTDNRFGYLSFKAGFSHKVIPSGDLVFGSVAEVKTNLGNTYFFYHAPSIGSQNGLRGYRDQRFTGKTYFYQSSDLRLRVKKFITAVAPVTFGIYGGFDYGRVWQPDEGSSVWHTSQGGGIWVGGYNYLSLSAGYFNSNEGNMFQVGFGFGF